MGDEVIAGVTVQNFSWHKFNMSDIGGNYKIPAREGDTLLFSSTSYFPDTLVVSFFMLNTAFDFSLKPHVKALPSITVNKGNNYQLDSLERRDYYKDFYKGPFPKLLTGNGNAPTDGFGITLSPLSFFSAKEKQRRKLKKHLAEQERDFYIDTKFTQEYVARLTRLRGDSLRNFMWMYRPSYKFCRKANLEDMVRYINDNFKLFMKKENQAK